MEKSKLNKEQPKQEITVVNKGIFYLLFQLVLFPFKALFWICKFVWKYISIYLGWLKEYFECRQKSKNLNRILSSNKGDEEIV